jgi:hypothetical protein
LEAIWDIGVRSSLERVDNKEYPGEGAELRETIERPREKVSAIEIVF